MTDKILSTFFTRIFSTLIMFVVVILNARVFGSEGTGTIALVILGLTLLQVLSDFIGGSTLVYLTPRKSTFQLLFLSYAWAFFSNIGGIALLYLFHLIPEQFLWHLFAMTLIYSVYNLHVGIMQGKEDIRTFNIFQLSQACLLILLLAAGILLCKARGGQPRVSLYLYAYILSFLIPTIGTCFYIFQRMDRPSFNGIGALLKEMFKLGFWTQLANLTQLLTYRLNYYFIEGFIGRKPLGIYELGTRISEAVWIFPKSICLGQYARIANNHEDEYAKGLTLGLLKIVFVFSLLAVLFLFFLPASFIAWIFGPDFAQSKPVINSLLPGILFLACMSVLSHHFSGYGKYWINAIGSLIGLVVTAFLSATLIPRAASASTMTALQVTGWISSTAYFCSLLFTLIVFIRHTHARSSDFLITRSDIATFTDILTEKIHSLKQKKA